MILIEIDRCPGKCTYDILDILFFILKTIQESQDNCKFNENFRF